MIQIENLSFKYQNEVVLDSCSAEVAPGKLVALLGSNGSGKSTLLNCIMAWLKPHKGKVLLNGKSVSIMSASERSASLAIVLSRIASIPMMTVEETLTVGLNKDQKSHEKLVHWMELCGISSFAKRNLDTLSDG
ncbi:MAG: ATP-binding cassette domain-containing protein, partial [Flavobacteriales bacterium]